MRIICQAGKETILEISSVLSLLCLLATVLPLREHSCNGTFDRLEILAGNYPFIVFSFPCEYRMRFGQKLRTASQSFFDAGGS